MFALRYLHEVLVALANGERRDVVVGTGEPGSLGVDLLDVVNLGLLFVRAGCLLKLVDFVGQPFQVIRVERRV